MTQEEKELLFKDLCSRLPYEPHGVKVRGVFFNCNKDVNRCQYEVCDKYFNHQHLGRYGTLKPYLFPLSSMTEKQKEELQSLMVHDSYGILYHTIESFDYLCKNHFDYRGLIEKGLAIDATNLNIY